MHKSGIDGENTGQDANQVDDLSRPAARGASIIQFSRADPPPGPAAGSEPPPLPAPFVTLASAVQAVVLRTANKRIRIKVARADEREDGGAGC